METKTTPPQLNCDVGVLANSRETLQRLIGELIKEGRTIEVPVFGYSMMPFLRPGVVARIAPVNEAEIKKGDVLFFDNCGQLVLHRVIKVLPNVLICRGDSLLQFDPQVEAGKALGRMEAWQTNHHWRTNSHWRFKLFKRMALYGGGCYQWCAAFYVRAMLKLARLGQKNGR